MKVQSEVVTTMDHFLVKDQLTGLVGSLGPSQSTRVNFSGPSLVSPISGSKGDPGFVESPQRDPGIVGSPEQGPGFVESPELLL